ncbi:restriction endonuclease subunit S [Bacillus cereus]|uniref:restriction endonuclease subunit S n=1 Tax=Bacillus cereus TaxID=1396 RepID=UPI0015E822B6|nr:restriction endonuclease subunit S [Bacillus cereus]
MSRYQEYKESGFQWVGKMPSHWNIIRHKYIFKKVQRIAGERSKEYDVMSLTMRGVIKRDVESNIGKMPASFDGYQIIQPDSLLLCLFDIDVTPRTIGYVTQEGITTAAYTNIETIVSDIYLKYYYYWFLMLDMDKTLLHMSKNLRNSIGNAEFMALSTIVPTFEEQKKICVFLDSKLNNINQLIDFKLKLINKLEEKRQSMITEAVTKGLNPNVKMKNSGVEWVGEIPDHWKKTRLDFIARVKARLGWKGLKAEEYVDKGHIFLSTPNLKGRYIDFKNVNYITEERYLESPEIMLEKGDVLLAKDGSTLGITNVVRELPAKATVNSSIAVLRPNELIDSIYFYYYLSSTYIQDIINQIKDGMGVPHLFQADIKKFPIILPPLCEQKEIVKYIDEQVENLDSLIETIKVQVQKLKGYRQSLIYEAVTGKIDVRDFEIKA